MADKKISELTSATTPLAGTEVLPIVQSNSTVKVAVSNLTAGRNVSLAGLTATGATQKLGAVTQTDITVQIGPDTPITTSSGRILFNTASDRKNWFINHNWNLAGGLSFAQSTVAGGSTMAADSHQWDLNGNYKIVNGDVIIGTAGKGIDFSATTNAAGMTSELLNDYEEGTWTPTDGSGAALTFEVINAQYTKIGRLVVATTRLIYPSTTDSSAAKISGLPFSTKASTDYSGIICNNASANTYSYYLGGNSTTVSVTQIGSVFTGVQNQFLASGQFLLTIIYNT